MSGITLRRALKITRNLARRGFREEEGLFLGEGPNILEEALKCGAGVAFVLYTARASARARTAAVIARARAAGIPAFVVGEEEFEKLADTKTPQGVLAAVRRPCWNCREILDAPRALFLVLDGLQDPGNLGTIFRAADAFGATAVFGGKGTVDAYNPKVVRASAGSVLRVPFFQVADLPRFLEEVRARGVFVAAADPGEGISSFAADLRKARLAFVVGSEARGVSPQLLALADVTVRIPLREGVDSLNAAVAAALLLYEYRRQNG